MADSNSTRRGNRFKDLTGKRFGKWTVIAEATNHPSARYVYWLCLCECGTEKPVRGTMLTANRSNSCNRCSKRQHGMEGTPEYNSWKSIKQRCNNPNCKTFLRYGGNNIGVCERWELFENFFVDMGPKPSESHSVDRIDGSKGYSPENCRWATPEEQARNTRTNRLLEFNGETRCLAEWAETVGIDSNCLHMRLKSGWSVERSLTTPASSHVQMIEFQGETMCLPDWATKVGIHVGTLRKRLLAGWSIERALTEPVKAKS